MANVVSLLDGVTGNVSGDATPISTRGIRGMYGVAQKTGNASVTVFGRLTQNHSWKQIHTFSGDDAVEIVLFPQMRAEVSGYVSGTIHLSLIGGGS